MSATRIPYLDAVWNPWLGCTRTGRAKCERCWCLPMLQNRLGIPEGTVRRASESTWKSLRRVKAGSVVGVCFLSDFFHAAADQWREDAWDALCDAAMLRDAILVIPTTRPERIAGLMPREMPGHFWSHVYWLISIGDQKDADEFVPIALNVPVGHVVVSYEPALGPVNFREWLPSLSGGGQPCADDPRCTVRRIEGVIFGCESGPGARWGKRYCDAIGLVPPAPCVESDPDCRRCREHAVYEVVGWARSCRDQCAPAGVNYCLKQLPAGPGVEGRVKRGIIELPRLDGRQDLSLAWKGESYEAERAFNPRPETSLPSDGASRGA
jgi:protein gp37